MAKFGHLGSKFWKTNDRFEISTFEILYRQNFVKRLESRYFLTKNAKICAFVLKILENKCQI